MPEYRAQVVRLPNIYIIIFVFFYGIFQNVVVVFRILEDCGDRQMAVLFYWDIRGCLFKWMGIVKSWIFMNIYEIFMEFVIGFVEFVEGKVCDRKN